MTIRKKFESEQKHSSLFGHLLQLFEDKERVIRKLEEKENDDKSLSSLSSAGTDVVAGLSPGKVQFSNLVEEASVNSFVAGFLPKDVIHR